MFSRKALRGSMLLAAGLLAGCGPAADPNSDTLKIGAYSVVREVLHEGILPAFAAHWKAKTGRTVHFEEAYNASGAQARSIAAGFDADLAILSHSGDMDLLVKAGKVSSDWDQGPEHGLITRSLVVIGHRPGNPKGISGWDDLARPGVGVLYPDPKTSGGARWNINAIYGARLLAESQPDEAAVAAFLGKVQANVVNMDPSGRQSVANFERGTGDALVTYENELLLRKREGKEIPFLIPEKTLIIEGPAAIVESSVEAHKSRAIAEEFLAYLRGPDARKIFADYGFRAVTDGPDDAFAPLPAGAFRVDDLGGWATLEEKLYGEKGVWTSLFTSGTAGGPG